MDLYHPLWNQIQVNGCNHTMKEQLPQVNDTLVEKRSLLSILIFLSIRFLRWLRILLSKQKWKTFYLDKLLIKAIIHLQTQKQTNKHTHDPTLFPANTFFGNELGRDSNFKGCEDRGVVTAHDIIRTAWPRKQEMPSTMVGSTLLPGGGGGGCRWTNEPPWNWDGQQAGQGTLIHPTKHEVTS